MSISLNQNVADCLQSSRHIGSTEFYNVCDGTIHTVPWGSLDHAFAIGGFAFLGGFALMSLMMAFSVACENGPVGLLFFSIILLVAGWFGAGLLP